MENKNISKEEAWMSYAKAIAEASVKINKLNERMRQEYPPDIMESAVKAMGDITDSLASVVNTQKFLALKLDRLEARLDRLEGKSI